MNTDIRSSFSMWPFVVMTTMIALFLPLLFADKIAEGGVVGMALVALAVLVPLALIALAVRSATKPRFVVTETGIQNAFLTEEVTWEEIAYIKLNGSVTPEVLLHLGSLEIAVRDDVEIIPRVTRLWRWLARLYGKNGPLYVFTTIHGIASPMPLEDLALEIERRAGRVLVARESPAAHTA